MTDNGAKALAERIHEVILSADYDAEDEAELILANGAVFLTAEEAERLRRIETAARAYIDWRDKRAAQWDAVVRHDHEHGMTPCQEWDELTSEPFDVDQRLDDALSAALTDPESASSDPDLTHLNDRLAAVTRLRARAVTDLTDPEPSHD